MSEQTVAGRICGQVAAVVDAVAPTRRRAAVVQALRLAFVRLARARGLAVEEPRADGGVARRLVAALDVVDGAAVDHRGLEIEWLGALYEALLGEDSRRRAGVHYTPRAWTERIVRTALAPVLAEATAPERVLSLKICDPAMGAGAFVLEACRQLAARLVAAGMDAATARSLVAQRCVHGVDLDPVAVELARLSLWLLVGSSELPLTAFDELLKCGESLCSFGWEREYGEVFGREDPGFDVMVGNPPFMGGVRISGATSPQYFKNLVRAFPGSGGQADLVAYFFRLAFDYLRRGGTLGLLATNTISQGATRRASLEAIVAGGGKIYAAERHVPWVGSAAVLASAVWIRKGEHAGPCVLDGAPQARISAFLVPHGGDEEPRRLADNQDLAFKGVEPYGDGFVFADGNPNANSLQVLARVRGPDNDARIFAYLGGEEFNRSPTQTATRYIIDFESMTLAEAGRWPQLLNIVRRRVRPERATKAADVAAWPWWQYWRTRPELRGATRGLRRVLALADTSKHLSLAFVPTGQLLNKTLVVVALDLDAAFAVLQSRVHEVWARFFGSSMKADLRYTARGCFETFPFPRGWRTDAGLAAVGAAYHRLRAECMIAAQQGLTGTYNRFHDPAEAAPEIHRLRALHDEMDRAVLAAYGWGDLAASAGFAGDPVRLRWSAAVQDELLARLLAENGRREGVAAARRDERRTTRRAAAG